MATIYKVQVVSHWAAYTNDQLQNILEESIKEKELEKGNVITIEVL